MTKEELQSDVISIFTKYRKVVLQWCTGLGKSKAAIDMLSAMVDMYSPDINVLLVVAETSHKSNWDYEFNKWHSKATNITIECYASLNKYRGTNWDLVIFDEAHHLGTDLKIDILKEINVENIILLSATLPDHIIESVSEIFGEFKISKVTLQQAIEWGMIPKPKVYLIPLTLDSINPNCSIIEEWGKKDKRVTYKCKYYERWRYLKNKSKYPNTTLEISCTQQQKYDYLSDQFKYWKKQFINIRQEFTKNKWLQAGLKRKRFLGESKIEAVKILLNKIKNKRFICFCASIEQAKLLGGKNAIHSQREDSLQTIDDFNLKKIDNLFAVGMLQEGQNLIDIEVGVIVQLDGQERAFIQKFGRSLRAEDPIQFIFYYKDTKDEEYLENIINDINKDYVTVLQSINNLKL